MSPPPLDLERAMPRGISGGGAPPPRFMYGGDGWDAVNQLRTAAGVGLGFIAAPLTIAWIVAIDTPVNGAYIGSALDGGGAGGWRLWQPNATDLRMDWGDGVGFPFAPAKTIVAGELDVFVCVNTGAAISMYSQGVLTGAPVAVGGYTQPAAAFRTGFGLRDNGTAPHTGARIFGAMQWSSALTAGEIASVYSQVRNFGRFPSFASDSKRYEVSYDTNGATFPSQLTEQIAGVDNFTFTAGSAAGINLVKVVRP